MKKNFSALILFGIVTVTPANSPYTITPALADCSRIGSELLVIVSGGAVTINLPAVSAIETQSSVIVIQGSTSAANVNVVASGTDVLGGVVGSTGDITYACGDGKGFMLEANNKGNGYCWFITGDKDAIR